MKSFGFLLFLLLCSVITFAQNKDVEVYEKKEGDKVIIMARNTGTADYSVKVNIKSQGMDVLPSASVEATVPGGFMKEMATITPRPGEIWSYGYDVSIMQTMAKPVTKTTTTTTQPGQSTTLKTDVNPQAKVEAPALSDAPVILYAKPGCGRCTYAKKQLNALGIKYLEVDTQSNSPEVPNMWSQLRNQGFTGGSVTMPVIRVNGTYHYDIKDMDGLINSIKG